MRRPESGNISLVALAGVALAIVLCLGVARVGAAAGLKARADTAADAAALAGADSLAIGQSGVEATRAARDAAADNGARLISCACAGASAEVVVSIGRAHAGARAETDARGRRAGVTRAPRLAP
jgi:hypothetical protein